VRRGRYEEGDDVRGRFRPDSVCQHRPTKPWRSPSLRPITGRPDAFRSVLRITTGQVRDRHRIPVILGRRRPHYLSASPMSSALN